MITFNIIYTPYTVKYLLPFAKSIVRYNDVNVRLVSNNCNEVEIETLKTEAISNDQLSFYPIKTNTILPHHEVLNQLYNLDQDEYFAFMDSDIFCNESFIQFFLDKLKTCSAVFSCKPISESPKIPEINKLQGRHFHDKNNRLIGGSYFAIYKRFHVEKIKDSIGFLFDRKNLNELSLDVRKDLELGNMIYERYDTSKLLNFFLRQSGCKLDYEEHTNLFHIGGVSWNNSLIQQKNNRPDFPSTVLGNVLRKRLDIAQYFSDYIAFCLDELTIPKIPNVSTQEIKTIKKVSLELKSLYNNS